MDETSKLAHQGMGPIQSFFALLFFLFLGACDDAVNRAKHHHESGLALLESGQPEKAVLEFRNALRLDEGAVAPRFELALLLEQAGDLKAAVANLRAVIESDPAHAPARVRLANAMLLAGKPEKAMQHAEIAVRTAPTLLDARIARALAAYRLGDVRFALSDLEQILERDPGHAEAGLLMAIERYDAGDVPAALETLDQFLRINPQNAQLHFAKLNYLQASANGDAVGAQLSTMVDRFPSRADIRQVKVRWHLEQEDVVSADEELRSLQRLLPDDPNPLLSRVRLAEQTHGIAVARGLLVKAIENATVPDALQLELARFDERTGDREAAAALLKSLIETGTADQIKTPARLLLARLHGQAGRFDAAADGASAVLQQDAGNAEAFALRAVANLRRDAIDDALFDIRGALSEQPGNPQYLQIAGEIYQRNGVPALAGESFASAVRESEYEPKTVLAYLRFLETSGQTRAQKTVLGEAVRRNPGSSEIAYELARLRMIQRDWPGAETLIETVSRDKPGHAAQLQAEIAIHRREYGIALKALDDVSEHLEEASAIVPIRVRTLIQNGDRTAARNLIQNGLASEPANEVLLQLDAIWHELERNPLKAEERYLQLIETEPKGAARYTAYGAFLDRQGRSDEAVQVLKRGLAQEPKNSAVRLHLASLALRADNHVEAIAEFEEIYAEEPDSMLAANNLASALAEYSSDDPLQLERAEKIARRLAGAANPAFRDTYGWIQVLTGNAADGLADLKAAADALPDNPWVRFHAGIAHQQVGRSTEARAHLKMALELVRDQPFSPRQEIHQALAELAE